MESKTRKTIKEAERLLSIRMYDAAHDLAHHKSVYTTAKDIAKRISENYDTHILEIACMWHDVIVKDYKETDHKEVTKDTADYLKDFMLDIGFTPAQANVAYGAVRHHEFDDTPVNTEGKILFDADKLDNLNLDRMRRFIASDKAGAVPKWKIKAYVKGGTAIVKQTRDKLHFDYSKQLFNKKVDELWDNEEVLRYAKNYDLDIEDIKKSLRRRTSVFDRVIGLVKR